MNVLPFVIIFIAVISLSWSSLMQTMVSSKRSCQGYVSHLAAFNDARSKIEKDFFAAAKKNEKKESPNLDRKDKSYVSPRLATRKESSKLFLSSSSDPYTITTFNKLLTSLYQDTPFFNDKLIERISEKLFQQITEDFELTSICFADEKMQEAWYCILKGNGCLPLSRFISFQENPKPIYFRYASKEVLNALLGEGIADEIIESEEEKYFSQQDKQSLLSEEEIGKILSSHNQIGLKKHLNFSSSPKVVKVVEGKDQDIVVEIKPTRESGPLEKKKDPQDDDLKKNELDPAK